MTLAAQDSFCANLVESIYDNYLGRDEYDIRELNHDPFPYTFYVKYLNSPKVQAAIGAYQNFSESSNTVYQAFTATGDDNREVGTIEALRKLIEQGITIMLYAGDADYKLASAFSSVVYHANLTSAVTGSEVKLLLTRLQLLSLTMLDLSISPRRIMSSTGQVKQAGKFSFVRIYESGHKVRKLASTNASHFPKQSILIPPWFRYHSTNR